MRKPLIFIIVVPLTVVLLLSAPPAETSDEGHTIDSILNSAELFFLSLKERDFETAWNVLSASSRESIINEFYKNSVKIGALLKRDDVVRDFERRGVMFRNYWKSFHRSFDTDIVLEQSLWKMGTVKESKAEIIIQVIIEHNKFSNPTVLRMFKENNAWKVGFNESFSRSIFEKWLDYLKIMHGV